MMSKLYDFYFHDHKARWTAYGWIAFIAFVYGAVSGVAFGRPEREVTWELVGLVGLLTLARAAWYVLQGQKPILEPQHTANEWKTLELFCRPAWTCAVIVSSLLLIRLVRIPSTRIEAIKVNRELIARLETGIRSNAHGGNTEQLVTDALALTQMQKGSGQTEQAHRILSMANELLAKQKEARVPADPKFFADVVRKYRSIQSSSTGLLADEAFRGTLQLAEYRSALATIPPDFHPKYEYRGGGVQIGELKSVDGHMLLKDSAFYGPNSVGPQGFRIDGFELENVLFENMTIRYDGGPVIFRNVWFVNCTFIVRQSQSADQFLEVAALGETSATIGG